MFSLYEFFLYVVVVSDPSTWVDSLALVKQEKEIKSNGIHMICGPYLFLCSYVLHEELKFL